MNHVRILAILSALISGVLLQPSSGQQPSLKPPSSGKIEVAFLISDGAVMIDFSGPWEVFQDVMTGEGADKRHGDPHAFHLYTVAQSAREIRASGGMRIVPDYTFENAPKPNVVVIPAQANSSPAVLAWIRKMTMDAEVVMSVCTGAFLLGEAGVLNGKPATTHHDAYTTFARTFPTVSLVKQKRFVQGDRNLFTSGGLSSGIDLALHLVELYYGSGVAAQTARHMEYESEDWSGEGAAKSDFLVHGLHAELDNLTKNQFGNPSTAFTQSGTAVDFSFSGDPSYKGSLSADGTRIQGILFMDDGSSTALTWARLAGSSRSRDNLLLGDWNATVQTSHGKQDLVLHIIQ